jgi:Zn-finger nucleic acid-binding protein
MLCPRCEVPLVPEVIGTTPMPAGPGAYRSGASYDLADPRTREIDRCPECGGVWLDAGEMEPGLQQVAPRRGSVRLPHRVAGPSVESGHPRMRCLRCNALMPTIRSGAAPQVVYDRCPACNGLWFDGGELRHFAQPVASLLALILKEFG